MSCFNSDCQWDGLDCGCAPGCAFSDLGSCKKECLVPDCNYDTMKGYPACSVPQSKKAAFFYQVLTQSYSSLYNYSGMCLTNAPACNATYWASANTTCVSKCTSAPCLYSFGNCAPTNGPANCDIVAYRLNPVCYQCKAGFLQLYQNCLTQCPMGYVQHPLQTNLCYPGKDTSIDSSPAVFYVVSGANKTNNSGSQEHPFYSIAQALSCVNSKNTLIYLSDGQHDLNVTHSSMYMTVIVIGIQPLRSLSEITKPDVLLSPMKITIKPLWCNGTNNQTFCAKSRPRLVQYNSLPSYITVNGTLILEDLVIDGYTILGSVCTSIESCSFCPYTTMISTVTVNDRNQTLANGAFGTNCNIFQAYSFINVASKSQLVLRNVSILNMRQRYLHLIKLSDSYLALHNVDFINCGAAQLEGGALIGQDLPLSAGSYNSSFIHFYNGTVSRLNNGFEMRDKIYLPGFIIARLVGELSLRNITFEDNFIAVGSAVTNLAYNSALGSLIYVNTAYRLRVENCTFNRNMGNNGGILSVYSDSLRWTNVITDVSQMDFLTSDHVIVANCAFRNNSGYDGALLRLVYQTSLQNIRISNCSFFNNLSMKSGLISLMKNGTLSEQEISGNTQAIKDAFDYRHPSFFPQNRLSLLNLAFDSCTVNSLGTLNIVNMTNIWMQNISIIGGIDSFSRNNFYYTTLSLYIPRPDIYMKLTNWSAVTMDHCQAGTYLMSVYNLTIRDIRFQHVQCLNGPAAGLINETRNGLTIENAVFHDNIGKHSSFGLMLVSALSQTTVTNIELTNNTNLDPAGASLLQIAQILSPFRLSQGRFERNSALQGGALYLFRNSDVTLSDSIFIFNAAVGGNGAALRFYTLKTTPSRLIVKNCIFDHNSAATAAGISISGLPNSSPLEIDISDTDFRGNSAGSGTALQIDTGVVISPTSIIARGRFTDNFASTNTPVFLGFASGGLAMSEVIFRGNRGPVASAIYGSFATSADQSPNTLSITDSEFTENSGSPVIMFPDNGVLRCLNTEKVTFTDNPAACLQLDFARWTDRGSLFARNKGSQGGAIIIGSSSVASATHTNFISNEAGDDGGALQIQEMSSFACSDCRFLNNTCGGHGGGIFLEQEAIVELADCQFEGNSAYSGGSAIYMIGCSGVSQMSNVEFRDNEAHSGGTVFLILTQLVLSDSIVSGNRAETLSPGIILNVSNLTMSNTTLSNQNSRGGAFLYLTTSSSVTASDCLFVSAIVADSGGAIYSLSSSVILLSCTLRDLTADKGSGIFAYSNSRVVAVNTSFSNLTSRYLSGGVLFTFDSYLRLENSSIINFSGGAIVAERMEMHLLSSVFANGFGDLGGAVYCYRCLSTDISNSTFQSIYANSGGALYLNQRKDGYLFSAISQSYFINNSAEDSGAVYANSIDLSVNSTLFLNNTAKVTQGGAITLLCEDLSNCSYSVVGNEFTTNSAGLQGGAISWAGWKPVISNNVFYNNTAQYGLNISSFAVSLSPAQSRRRLASNLTLTDVASGQMVDHPLELELLDHYGQRVLTDNSSLAELQAVDSNATSVQGSFKVTAKEGVYTFKEYIITSTPGTSTYLRVVSDALSGVEGVPGVMIKTELRECQPGETRVLDECVVCPSGKFSLNASGSCLDCPPEALCYGNTTMVPRTGYWRSSNMTSHFIPCFNVEACLGSPSPPLNISQIGMCAKGYTGNLCQVCEPGYSHMSQSTCKKCPGSIGNGMRIGGMLVIFVLMALYLINSSIKSAGQTRMFASTHVKILINYFQMVMLASNFNLSWPDYMLQFFLMHQSVGSLPEQLMSVDCFFEGFPEDEILYTKLIITVILPAALLIGSLLVWLGIALVKQNLMYLRNELWATFIILIFIIHASLIKTLFSVFNCVELDPGQYWLAVTLNTPCWTETHLKWALLVALPGVILWGFALPAICLLILLRSRKRLFDSTTRVKLGFLYTGYRPEVCFWEIHILYRKIAIVMFAVFLQNISVRVQALCTVLLLVIAIYLQKKYSPYATNELNNLELRSLFVASGTIYSGLYFITGDLPENGKVVIFALVIMINMYFFFVWVSIAGRVLFGLIARIFNLATAKYGSAKTRPEVSGDVPKEVNSEMLPENDSNLSLARVPQSSFKLLNSSQDFSELEQRPIPE